MYENVRYIRGGAQTMVGCAVSTTFTFFWISFGCLKLLDSHKKHQELDLLAVITEKAAKSTYVGKSKATFCFFFFVCSCFIWFVLFVYVFWVYFFLFAFFLFCFVLDLFYFYSRSFWFLFYFYSRFFLYLFVFVFYIVYFSCCPIVFFKLFFLNCLFLNCLNCLNFLNCFFLLWSFLNFGILG